MCLGRRREGRRREEEGGGGRGGVNVMHRYLLEDSVVDQLLLFQLNISLKILKFSWTQLMMNETVQILTMIR